MDNPETINTNSNRSLKPLATEGGANSCKVRWVDNRIGGRPRRDLLVGAEEEETAGPLTNDEGMC